LDRGAVHLEERRIRHGAEGQAQPGVEEAGGAGHGAHWQASQVSGFSSEHATRAAPAISTLGGAGVHPGSPRGSSSVFSGSLRVSTVVLAMRVAGRDLK